MARRKRSALSEGEGGSIVYHLEELNQTFSLEELVERLLWYSRKVPDCAFAHYHIGPQGTRYIPCYSERVHQLLEWRGLTNPTILKERIDFMARQTVEHFPSCPTRNPKYGIFFRDLQLGKLAHHGFCTAVASKSFIDLVINATGEKPVWTTDQEFMLGSIQVRSVQLEDIMETEGSIRMPDPYPAYAGQIAGRAPERYEPDPEASTDEERPRKRKERAKREPQAPRAPRDDGSTSASDIASSLGLDASAARRILRAANVEKPYAWTEQKDIDRITSILKAGKKK